MLLFCGTCWSREIFRRNWPIKLYLNYIRPALQYVSPVWHSSINTDCALSFERMRASVLRLILKAEWETFKSVLFKLPKWSATRAAWTFGWGKSFRGRESLSGASLWLRSSHPRAQSELLRGSGGMLPRENFEKETLGNAIFDKFGHLMTIV